MQTETLMIQVRVMMTSFSTAIPEKTHVMNMIDSGCPESGNVKDRTVNGQCGNPVFYQALQGREFGAVE